MRGRRWWCSMIQPTQTYNQSPSETLNCKITFNYLGSTIPPFHPWNDMSAELKRRVGLARSSFLDLGRGCGTSEGSGNAQRWECSVLWWCPPCFMAQGHGPDKIWRETTQYCLARFMLGSRPTDHVCMTTAYHKLGMVSLRVQLAYRTLSWAARLINLPGDHLPRLVMFSQLLEGRQNCGCLTFQWSELRWANLPAYQDWATEVQSEHWRSIIRGYCDHLCQSFQNWCDR